MKSYQDISNHIQALKRAAMNASTTTKERIKIRKELEFNKVVLVYLESSPREEFLKKELERIVNILNTCDENWYQESKKYENLPASSLSEIKKTYFKDIDISTLRNQVKTLKYILS